MLSITIVPPREVSTAWLYAQPHLERAVPYSFGRYGLDDIKEDCIASIQHLWLVYEMFDAAPKIISAFTTRISDYPQKRTLNLQFCGGDRLKDWIGLANETLARFALDNGCVAMEMTGRTGWKRILKRIGWEEICRVYERKI